MNLEALLRTDINLIPPASNTPTGSYVCTWWSQNPAASDVSFSEEAIRECRNALNQDQLFGEKIIIICCPKNSAVI